MKQVLTFITFLIFSTSIHAKDNNIFTPVSDLFLAVSNVDHSQMHSTRLPLDEIPKGVTFIKQ